MRLARNNRARLRRYGLTLERYAEILAAQGDACAVCGRALSEGLSPRFAFPHIDHDHRTGKVRGILHPSCNVLLGHARNDPETLMRAAEYLRRGEEA